MYETVKIRSNFRQDIHHLTLDMGGTCRTSRIVKTQRQQHLNRGISPHTPMAGQGEKKNAGACGASASDAATEKRWRSLSCLCGSQKKAAPKRKTRPRPKIEPSSDEQKDVES